MVAILEGMPVSKGNHLDYRGVEPGDAPLIHSWLRENKLLLYKPYLHITCPNPQALARYIRFHHNLNPRIEMEFMVFKKNTLTPAGLVGLQNIDHINKKAEISLVTLRQPALRLGLEAIWRAVVFAFGQLEMEKLIFHVLESNEPFLHFLEKRRWKPEAVLKKEIKAGDGGRLDVFRFGIFPDFLKTPLWQSLLHVVRQ